jgi:ferredoxin
MVSTPRVTVEVDRDVCVGNGMCRAIAPATFAADESGQSTVRSDIGDELRSILEAAEMCPIGAISVRDAETAERLDF